MARVLVVEDSPDIQVLVRMLLDAAGHQVFIAADGREGVDIARKERPDLILMDLSLPVLSGWEATREIKADLSTARIPVLAVTAHAMEGDRERALAAGCDGFVSKPIDEASFGDTIAAYLTRKDSDQSWSSETWAPHSQKSPSANGGHILIVDDQNEIAELIRIDLEKEGHRITIATSREEAFESFPGETPFDLAVIDVMLSGDSAYELTSELIARSADYLPVLLVTAGTIDRERGYAAGADDFIGKPIESAELRARARSLIRIGRAIREQGRAVKDRAEAYDKLLELDRLKSDFLSTVSHELRTPLNTIILLSHLIEREGAQPSDEARRQHDVRVIRESAETLLRMINNILDLAKLEAGQQDLYPQRMELAPFLREMVDMLEPEARTKGIALTLEADPRLPEAAVLDREKLSRVLLNLLSNAVKYTRAGRIELRAEPWQDSIAFEVQDTGSGVPAHLIAAAFEPFRQIRLSTGETGRGTGLGLPISKQLVELMGGDLLFDSREGEGTRVSFTLPQMREPAGARAAGERPLAGSPPRAGASGKARRVLIVEDDAASRYGLKSLLDSEGYRIHEAGTVAEAEDGIRRFAPDLVVLDITLPDGDGAEWLKLIQKRGPLPCPVIALTGVTADQDRRRIEEAGVRAVLNKPVDVTLLFEALRDCLEPAASRQPSGAAGS